MRRNADAKAGDALILTKPIGVGIYSAAIKKGVLVPTGYAEMIATTTLLNRVGAELAQDAAVHAITDVTGFGLLGHALEMARGSKLALSLRAGDRAAAGRGRSAGAAGVRDRRLASQLGELWRAASSCRRGLPGLAPPSADRSADLGRPADRLRVRSRR